MSRVPTLRERSRATVSSKSTGIGQGKWRWRLRHRSGNIIATGGEGYASRRNAEKGLRSVMQNAPGAELVYQEG